ncbi:hypothetical protein ACFXOD_36080 [Streptomyces sp. NPDC059161]|uniref:hypothetical protein n=1 Tax=Streptomyces sp. NPDC059161 TaxID=3346749 RepID=UPI0036A27F8B
MTDWSTLTDACGTAEHVPSLLDRFEADPNGVRSEVMAHLCPQLDTAFPASYEALPRLAQIASACGPEELTSVLLAAGAIAACSPGLSEPDSPLTVYSAPIGVLHMLTDRHLSRAVEAGEYVDLLQSLLSFEGAEIWDRCLDGLHSGEYEVVCLHCGVNMFIVLGQDGYFCCTDDYALGEVEKSPLQPVRAEDLAGLPRRLFTRAVADGQEELAHGIPYLFGRTACPDCGTDFSVAERVVAGWTL